MKKKTAAVVALFVVLIFAGLLLLGRSFGSSQPDDNEIRLKIQLDLGEDIGLFLIDSDIDGQQSSGGSSNADKSMLMRDDTIYWMIDRQHYPDAANTVNLVLKFTVVTEYFDPNYDNDYPEECMISLDPLSFAAVFGELYQIRIVGDNANGYQAVLEQE